MAAWPTVVLETLRHSSSFGKEIKNRSWNGEIGLGGDLGMMDMTEEGH